MAKKKTAHSNNRSQVEAVEEKVRLARQALLEAEEQYRQARREIEGIDDAKNAAEADNADEAESILGELCNSVLALVKKYPSAGVTAAAAIGFYLGRLFRR